MFQEIFITEITTSELLVCRVCLATDVRLYDMRENRLMEVYSTLLSTAIQVTDDLPHYLCNYCAALLLKYDSFRIKCIDAQIVLKNAILPNLELTMKNTKQIDRLTHFRQSYIQIINIDDTNPNPNPNINAETELTEALKEEFVDHKNVTIDNFSDNSNISINENSNNEINSILQTALLCDQNVITNARTTRKRKIETEVSNELNKIKHEDLQSNSNINIATNENLLLKTNNSTDFEINKTGSNTDDVKNTGSKANPKIPRRKPKTLIDKKVTNKKNVEAEPNVNKKNENVSKLYNMDEVNVSKEEQLKEIQDRKTSESYLQGDFKCDFCYKGFRLKESFNSHMILHDDRSGKLVCEICHCHFQTKKTLRKHKATHGKKFTCKHASCEYVTKHLSQAREHFKWHGGVKDTCKHCGKECSGQTSYYHHLKLYHPTSDDLIRCEICGTSCSGPIGFKMHEKRTHKEMYSPDCRCSRCKTQFFCSDAFKTHQGSEGACDRRAKYCVRCGMAFKTEELLKEHEIEQRKPRTMFKCEVCNKNFEGYTSLKKHQLRHEMTLNRRLSTKPTSVCKGRLICEICGKVLSNEHILKQHYLNKHSTENPFKCTECPKTFRSAINLKLHIRIHTGERPHPCPHCPNTFRSVTNLRRHVLVHTDARPHSCEICLKAFKTKADCKAHIQTVHMKIYRPRVRRKYKKNE